MVPLINFHADESHRHDHFQNPDFSGSKLESASAPSRGGWNAWNSTAASPEADGRGRKPSYQNSFCAFGAAGRSAALPCQGQIIPVQWSRLTREGNCPKADNHPRASAGASEGAIEGRTDGGNNNGRFRSLSDGWTVAAVRRSSMKDVKLGVLQCAAQLERKEMVRQ